VSARDDLRAKRRRARRNSYWLRIGRDLKAVRREGLTLKVYRALNETAYGLQLQLERELFGIPGLVTAETDYPPVFQGVMSQKTIDVIEHRNAVFQSILDDTFRGDGGARWGGPHHGACPCPACLIRDGELRP
jgi:hypothetical protein